MPAASRQRAAVALVVVALLTGATAIGAVGATVADSPAAADDSTARELGAGSQRIVAGYYRPDQFIDLASNAVLAGTYRISYSADVRFEEPVPGATLTCAIRDPSTPALIFRPDSTTVVPASVVPRHITFAGIYALPPMSFGVRCQTSVAGSVRIVFTNIQLNTTAG